MQLEEKKTTKERRGGRSRVVRAELKGGVYLRAVLKGGKGTGNAPSAVIESRARAEFSLLDVLSEGGFGGDGAAPVGSLPTQTHRTESNSIRPSVRVRLLGSRRSLFDLQFMIRLLY